jgi:hypothetical protein
MRLIAAVVSESANARDNAHRYFSRPDHFNSHCEAELFEFACHIIAPC